MRRRNSLISTVSKIAPRSPLLFIFLPQRMIIRPHSSPGKLQDGGGLATYQSAIGIFRRRKRDTEHKRPDIIFAPLIPGLPRPRDLTRVVFRRRRGKVERSGRARHPRTYREREKRFYEPRRVSSKLEKTPPRKQQLLSYNTKWPKRKRRGRARSLKFL